MIVLVEPRVPGLALPGASAEQCMEAKFNELLE